MGLILISLKWMRFFPVILIGARPGPPWMKCWVEGSQKYYIFMLNIGLAWQGEGNILTPLKSKLCHCLQSGQKFNLPVPMNSEILSIGFWNLYTLYLCTMWLSPLPGRFHMLFIHCASGFIYLKRALLSHKHFYLFSDVSMWLNRRFSQMKISELHLWNPYSTFWSSHAE